ncbi:UNVERIFIED_CONTAM: thiamine-phosphate kinase [Halobacillus marinus]
MDEFSFIQSIQPKFYRQSSLIKGIQDDAAVFRAPASDIVTAVDTMVEGVHFTKDTMTPYHVGHRVLAANISDLAAMGSTPAYYLVSITIPSHWEEQELHDLYAGMDALAAGYHMDLIGGDTVSGQELSVTVTVIGMVDKNKARYRSVAQPADVVFVTGTLGDSRGGLEWLLKEGENPDKETAFLVERHRMPLPRVSFAAGLSNLERVALNDISDGIANEANEIAEASDVDLIIDADYLPYSDALMHVYPDRYKEWMLSGGEDFELLGTVPEKDWERVQQIAEQLKLRITRVGSVTSKRQAEASVYLQEHGQRKRLEKSGYTHLRSE